MIAVPFARAPTTMVEDTDSTDPMEQDLPFSSAHFFPATAHLLLQPMVKDIKAAKALDVVVDKDSLPVVDVVDVVAQHAPHAPIIPKKKPLLRLTTKSPTLLISIPTLKISRPSNTMTPSVLVSMSTTLLPVTTKHTTVTHMKVITLSLMKIFKVTTIQETTESPWLTPSDQS